MTPDERCASIADRQHGAFSLHQALGAGLTRQQIKDRVNAGRFERALPRVLRMSGAPRSWHQRVAMACLYGGGSAVASHRTAAALWRLDGFHRGVVEISVTKSLKPPAAKMVFHRFAAIPEVDRTRWELLPVTTPARTLLDLGRVVRPHTVEFALESALRETLVDMDELWDVLRRHARRGRGGVRCLRSLLAARATDATPSDSPLEIRLFNLIAASTLPLPIKQYAIVENGLRSRRIDLAYPEAKLAIEAESYRHHSGRSAWLNDSRRDNFVVARGWRVLRIVDEDVRQRPGRVIDEIRSALSAQLCESEGP